MRSYHFDLGNSSAGPVGYCARIWAETEDRALDILREALPTEATISQANEASRIPGTEGVEYLCVYFNPEQVSTTDIDDEEDEEV
jgi:hypothetical protein